MSGRKFILFFLGIFIIGALPIVILQPTGASSAGLSAGFALPFEHPWALLLLAISGILVALIGREALITLPICLLSMLVAGHMLGLSPTHYTAIPYILLGSILLIAFIVGMMERKAELWGSMMAMSVGFQLGWHTIKSTPEIASPLYFLIGVLLGSVLILAISASLSLTFLSDESPLGRFVRDPNRWQKIRLIFNEDIR